MGANAANKVNCDAGPRAVCLFNLLSSTTTVRHLQENFPELGQSGYRVASPAYDSTRAYRFDRKEKAKLKTTVQDMT